MIALIVRMNKNINIEVDEIIDHLNIEVIMMLIIQESHKLKMKLTMKNDNKIDNFY